MGPKSWIRTAFFVCLEVKLSHCICPKLPFPSCFVCWHLYWFSFAVWQIITNNTHLWSQSFYESGVWAWLRWVRCSGAQKGAMQPGLGSHLKLRIFFRACGYWKNSVPCSCFFKTSRIFSDLRDGLRCFKSLTCLGRAHPKWASIWLTHSQQIRDLNYNCKNPLTFAV